MRIILGNIIWSIGLFGALLIAAPELSVFDGRWWAAWAFGFAVMTFGEVVAWTWAK